MKKLNFDIQDWQDVPLTRHAIWRAENGTSAPKRLLVADDTLNADSAYRLACAGCGLLWQGDFQNARQLLQAIARRCDHPPKKSADRGKIPTELSQRFHLHRQAQSQRARILGMILIPLNADYSIALKRAPDVTRACIEAYGPPGESSTIVSLRELQSLIGAHEWRKKGVHIPALAASIHPHYGVFSPVRGEYIDLVATAPLPRTDRAFDIGTGTGVLAAVLAQRGVQQVVATDIDPRALRCAQENIDRLGFTDRVNVTQADLFPDGRAGLIICNPPWIPARPSSSIEAAIFDWDNRMLHGFIAGLAAHLKEGGEGWLLLSDLAEHLGLRSREQLLLRIASAGLRVVDRLDIKPHHPKTTDTSDTLHTARAAEITSLWRLQTA